MRLRVLGGAFALSLLAGTTPASAAGQAASPSSSTSPSSTSTTSIEEARTVAVPPAAKKADAAPVVGIVAPKIDAAGAGTANDAIASAGGTDLAMLALGSDVDGRPDQSLAAASLRVLAQLLG